MEKGKFELDISQEKRRFKTHLELSDNNQIIFSGIFGIGKTYFLNKFFKTEKENYAAITISPVNYSISNNDDIIDYIKYDIIFQLLSKGINFEKTDFSKGLTSQMYVKENFKEVMAILAKNASKINKTFSAIFNSLNEIKGKIETHNSSVNIDDEKELITFLKDITEKTGAIYEENRITQLISKLIEGLKEDNKKVILVIDDTDRLDPEHIFRILNVFACHFEFDNTAENKFGFDKVILVCDIENIKKMFHSKYGLDVDFSGYIDKFFSQEIFYFDNKRIIKSNLIHILKTIGQNAIDTNYLSLTEDNDSNKILNIILTNLISINAINLRTLLNLSGKAYKIPRDYLTFNNDNEMSLIHRYDILLIFNFLISLYGSKQNFEKALDKLSFNIEELLIKRYESIDKYSDLINFISNFSYNYKTKDNTGELEIEELDVIFNYELMKNGYDIFLINIEISNLNRDEKRAIPFFQMLKIAYEKYKQTKYLN